MTKVIQNAIIAREVANMICPKCGGSYVVKNGCPKGVQRYKCKNAECKYQFTKSDHSSKYLDEVMCVAVKLNKMGLPYRVIAKLFDIKSHNSIQVWRYKNSGYKIKRAKLSEMRDKVKEIVSKFEESKQLFDMQTELEIEIESLNEYKEKIAMLRKNQMPDDEKDWWDGSVKGLLKIKLANMAEIEDDIKKHKAEIEERKEKSHIPEEIKKYSKRILEVLNKFLEKTNEYFVQ